MDGDMELRGSGSPSPKRRRRHLVNTGLPLDLTSLQMPQSDQQVTTTLCICVQCSLLVKALPQQTFCLDADAYACVGCILFLCDPSDGGAYQW